MAVLYKETNLWFILFQVRGSVWWSVLPYCLVNVGLAYLVIYAQQHRVIIAFHPQGHGLVGLLVSFLVINKIYIVLDRYMMARSVMGRAASTLRELHQMALVFTEGYTDYNAQKWREDVHRLIVNLLDSTIRVIQDDKMAAYLSRGEYSKHFDGNDPMAHAHNLKSHLFQVSQTALEPELQLFERMKLLDGLMAYINEYRELLKIASTPLPFPIQQMGRTFLFLWVFSMPMALVGMEVSMTAVTEFVFFLTYGYVGLELVSLHLMYPFDDDKVHSINVKGMRETTVAGMTFDAKAHASRDARYAIVMPRGPMDSDPGTYVELE